MSLNDDELVDFSDPLRNGFLRALGQERELLQKWTMKERHYSNLQGTAHPKIKMVVSNPADYLYSSKHNTFCKMQLADFPHTFKFKKDTKAM